MTAVTLFAVIATVAAPLPKERPKPTPSILGEWVLVKLTYDGIAREEDPVCPDRYVFSDDGTFRVFGGTKERYGGLRFVTDRKPDPATADLDLPMEFGGRFFQAIYKFDGDIMTFCFDFNDKPRPTKFEANADSSAVLYVFKRAKKE
jgi:uncharacterized protein (TIGR03067 family)